MTKSISSDDLHGALHGALHDDLQCSATKGGSIQLLVGINLEEIDLEVADLVDSSLGLP